MSIVISKEVAKLMKSLFISMSYVILGYNTLASMYELNKSTKEKKKKDKLLRVSNKKASQQQRLFFFFFSFSSLFLIGLCSGLTI